MTRVLIDKEKKVFMEIEAGPEGWGDIKPWKGIVPLKAEEVKDPIHRWSGKKIPHALFQKIKAFFEWSQRETKAETLVHLFYHSEHGWEALVLPQRGYAGMSINLIADHPNVTATKMRLPDVWDGNPENWDEKYNKSWVPMGTVHHHCTSSAFQSTTDRDDEKTKEGLHITMGNITHAKYSIDARVSFHKSFTAACLADWFEINPDFAAAFPDLAIQDQMIRFGLCKPPEATDAFPDWWKENVIRSAPPTNYHGYHDNRSVHTTTSEDWRKSKRDSQGGEKWVPKRVAHNLKENKRKKEKGLSVHETRYFIQEVEAFCEEHKISKNDFLIYIQEAQVDPIFEAAMELIMWVQGHPLEQAAIALEEEVDIEDRANYFRAGVTLVDSSGKEIENDFEGLPPLTGTKSAPGATTVINTAAQTVPSSATSTVKIDDYGNLKGTADAMPPVKVDDRLSEAEKTVADIDYFGKAHESMFGCGGD